MIDLKKMGLTKLLAGAGLVKVGIDRLTKGKKRINAKAEKYAESLKNRIEPKKARTSAGRKLLTAIAVGLGAVGAAVAGLGAAKAVRERLIKKAVILVGTNSKAMSQGVSGFNGYLLKYTDLDGLEDMIDTLAGNGFTELIIVPMTIINGCEFDKIKDIASAKRDFFEKISCANALLTSDSDYEQLADTLISFADGADEDTAVVYVGKGTTHHANASYIALSERVKRLGGCNVFIGTAEGYPDFEKVEDDIAAAHYQNVVLCPLELTLDQELTDDICGEENSWYARLTADGYNCGWYMKGLCASKAVRRMVVEHTKAVM